MDISYFGLALTLLLLLYPLLIFSHLKLKLSRQLFSSFARMIIQLALIGLVLELIFKQMNPWLTLGWMLVMLSNAIFTLKTRLKLSTKIILPVLIMSLAATSLIIMPWIILLAIKPTPLHSPYFLIPIYGMVLGNSMNSCALALERFESGLTDNWKIYYTRLSLGASLWEAVLPPFRKALQTSLMPQLMTIASIGVVSLPGMMTGQILGGSSPLVAIKYQMMIMISIFTGVCLTDYLSIRLYIRRRFDRFYLPIIKD